MDISVVFGWQKEFPWNSSRLGKMWTLSTDQEVLSADWGSAPTLRRIFGSSWEMVCGGNTGQISSTMPNTSTSTFWSLS